VAAVVDLVAAVADAAALEAAEVVGTASGAGAIGATSVAAGGVTARRFVSSRSAWAPRTGEENGWIARSSAAAAPARMADATTTVRRCERSDGGGVSMGVAMATGATLPSARASTVGAWVDGDPDLERARACSTQSRSEDE